MNIIPTGLEVAKAYQWDLTLDIDPVEVAIKGHEAAYKLREINDQKIQRGLAVRVHAFGAFILEQWNEKLGGYTSVQFDEVVADGESLGISFIQYSPTPELSTLFLGLSKVTLREIERTDDGEGFAEFTSPKLVIPILDVDAIEIAA